MHVSLRLAAFAAATVTLGLAAGSPRPAAADAVADFYKGKTVTVLTAFEPSGGFGLAARLVVDHMGRFIPGHPRLQPQFMGGAGGLKGANYFYNVSPKDGTVIGQLSQVGPLFQRLKGEKGGFRYDASKLTYLGRLVTMEAAVMGRTASGFTSLEALKKGKSVACAAGRSHQGYINARALGEIVGFDVKIVAGYPGTSEMLVALERGECSLMVLSMDTWKTRGQRMIQERIVTPLAMVALERSEDLPNVPATPELAPDEDGKRVLSFIASYAGIGRAFALPPGVPADRVAALKTAFVAMYKDPAFVAAAKKIKMDLSVAPGEVVQKHVHETIAAPDAIADRARKVMGM